MQSIKIPVAQFVRVTPENGTGNQSSRITAAIKLALRRADWPRIHQQQHLKFHVHPEEFNQVYENDSAQFKVTVINFNVVCYYCLIIRSIVHPNGYLEVALSSDLHLFQILDEHYHLPSL